MRKWELKHYGFECSCMACSDRDVDGTFAAESHGRRWHLREIFDNLDFESDKAERLKNSLQAAKLMREEGMCTPNMAQLYVSASVFFLHPGFWFCKCTDECLPRYIQIARLFADKNAFEYATRAAEKGYDIYKTCLGINSQRTKDAEKSVRAFERQIQKPRKIASVVATPASKAAESDKVGMNKTRVNNTPH
jgi:hypothetical protein